MWHEPPSLRITRGRRAGFRVDRRGRAARARRAQGHGLVSGQSVRVRKRQLDRAGIDFEAVPGMTVEMAAPVMSGIPLTIEGRANSLGLGLVKGAETVVLRLASGWWEAGISKLMSDGRPAATPAALILSPGLPGQRRVTAPLGELARKAATYGLS